MMIDVMRDATTEHEIYFLLTAYIEAVRFCDKLNCMPESITRLPLRGMADLRTRFGELIDQLDVASRRLDDRSCTVLREALHIFGTALQRLGALNQRRPRPRAEIHAQAA
jgi:hypothetical protein